MGILRDVKSVALVEPWEMKIITHTLYIKKRSEMQYVCALSLLQLRIVGKLHD